MMDAKMIARAVQEYGTPSYVFDIDVFQNRIRMIQEVLGSQVQLCYAMKANPFLIGVAAAKSGSSGSLLSENLQFAREIKFRQNNWYCPEFIKNKKR